MFGSGPAVPRELRGRRFGLGVGCAHLTPPTSRGEEARQGGAGPLGMPPMGGGGKVNVLPPAIGPCGEILRPGESQPGKAVGVIRDPIRR
jgi:hypothetical protein